MTASAPSLVHPVTRSAGAASPATRRVDGRPLALDLSSAAAGAAALAAATLTVAMAFIAIAHLSGGMRFGDGTHSPIVDGLHVLTIALLIPLPFALHRRLGHVSARSSAAAVALAVDAIAFGAILHLLFALGVVTFEAAGPLLLIAYAAFAGWMWIVGSLGSRSGLLPDGRRMAVLGVTIVGLPIWLVWAARRLDLASASRAEAG